MTMMIITALFLSYRKIGVHLPFLAANPLVTGECTHTPPSLLIKNLNDDILLYHKVRISCETINYSANDYCRIYIIYY